jgi:hypothetical protein
MSAFSAKRGEFEEKKKQDIFKAMLNELSSSDSDNDEFGDTVIDLRGSRFKPQRLREIALGDAGRSSPIGSSVTNNSFSAAMPSAYSSDGSRDFDAARGASDGHFLFRSAR